MTSQPSGAAVTLDGVNLGETPLTVNLKSGLHQVGVSCKGFETATDVIAFKPGEEVVREVTLLATTSPANREETRKIPVADTTAPVPQTHEEAPKTAAELIARARQQRKEWHWPAAAAIYRQILKRYPEAPEAGVAKIGLAETYLVHLDDPEAALSLFEAYSAQVQEGALAQEAAFGRIRALRALGRAAEERVMIEAFIATYPEVVQSEAARLRLAELKGESAQRTSNSGVGDSP